MELLKAANASASLRASVHGIIASNNINQNSPWHNYEVLTAALKEGRKEVVSQLLDIGFTVNKDVKSSEPSDTPLHNAIKLADVQLVEKLLGKGASITAIDSDSNTPLHLAFLLKHYKIVDLLLLHIEETSSYDDMINKDGLTHLHIACARGNAQLAYSFEYVGADIDSVVSKTSQEYPGYTCLEFACDSKCLDTIKVVVRAVKLLGNCMEKKKRFFSFMSYPRNWNRTIIATHHEGYSFDEKKKSLSEFQKACFNGRVDEVEKLITNGEDVNARMTKDTSICPLSTPLHFAVEAEVNRQKVVELLLAHGADVNSKNGLYMTPLHCALYSDPYRQAKVLYGKDPEQDDTLKVIYKAVKDKESNPMDPFGLTYFHVAVALNDMDMVKKFIETGQADCKPILPNQRNFSMWTPLHFAVKYGHEDMAKLLIERGADVDANQDQNHLETPLEVAVRYGQCKMVNFLLARGANAKVVTYDGGKTMMHLVVQRFGDYEDEKLELLRLVDTLIRCGVDVNAADSNKFTPLHRACWRIDKAAEIVDELLRQGADVNALDKHDNVPFDNTERRDSKVTPEVLLGLYYHVKKLKQLGVKVDSKNDEFCETVMKKKEEWNKSEDWPAIEKMCSNEELARRQQEWTEEIEKLKVDMLNEKVSLCAYLRREAKQAAEFAKNERIEKLVGDEQLRSVYAAYGYLIPVAHRNSLRWLESQQPVEDAKPQCNTVVVKYVNGKLYRAGDLVPPIRREKKPVSPSEDVDGRPLPADISLLDAVKLGNVKCVAELLAKGVSTKHVDDEKNGLLHLAFTLGHEKIVDLLLENSEFDNSPNDQGLTRLHIAASRGNTLVVQKLLDAGANAKDFVREDSPMFAGYTALRFACDSKHLETAKVLTKAMKVFGNVTDDIEKDFAEMSQTLKDASIGRFLMTILRDKETLSEFHEACFSNKTTAEDVSRFLNRRKNVNAPMTRNSKNYALYTALHFAVESSNDRQKKVELLLRHGADVDRKNDLGMTPLHLACYNDAKDEANRDPFERREKKKDDTLRVLYDAVKDKQANPMDAFGLTYFHIAVARDDRLRVKRMIFEGEDVDGAVLPNMRDFSNYSPLHFAANYGRKEMAEILVERGAKVRDDDDDSPRYLTPLQTAIACGSCGVMEVLLEHGANARVVQPASKKTTLHLLVDRFEATSARTTEGQDEKGELEWFVEKLAQAGASVDAKDKDGFTALQSACANILVCSDAVRWLLWMGADINIKARGKTALEWANESWFKDNYEHYFMLYEHVQKLKDLGMKVDAKNELFCEQLLKDRKRWDEDEDRYWGWDYFKTEYGDEGLARKKRARLQEIRMLKKDMLTDKVSMYDYVRMSAKKAAAFLGDERLRKIDGVVAAEGAYEIFGFLIPVVYRRSRKWVEEQESSEKAAAAKKPVVKAQGAKRKRS